MVKRFIIFSLLACIASSVVAQQPSGGIKGGLNFANQKWEVSVSGFGSDSEKYKGTSFHIGGYINYPLNDVVSLQPELMYSQLNVDADGQTIKLNYLSLPVLLGHSFEENKLVFQAGPQIGVLLSSDPGEFKEDDYMKGIDFSLAFGAVYNAGKFNLGIRYTLGLMNIVQPKLEDDTEAELEIILGQPVELDMSIKNSNLQLSLGYKLFGE